MLLTAVVQWPRAGARWCPGIIEQRINEVVNLYLQSREGSNDTLAHQLRVAKEGNLTMGVAAAAQRELFSKTTVREHVDETATAQTRCRQLDACFVPQYCFGAVCNRERLRPCRVSGCHEPYGFASICQPSELGRPELRRWQ